MSQKNVLFDVFLSHSSVDKSAVEALARQLEDEVKLKPWLDKWNLVPGEPWQEALEDALDQSGTCAVFLGPSAIGPWHNEEMRSALDKRAHEHSFRVIPVLLPGATMPERGELPRFLSRLTWVDFRGPDGLKDKAQFHRFICGIKGIPPGRSGDGTSEERQIECPYRGLQVFDETHACFFFGREAMTQHLVEVLRHTRFLAVLGPSGSGKSSLARAGLLPQLRIGGLPGSQDWSYLIFRPGAHPLQELALSLAQKANSDNPVTQAQQLIVNCGQDEKALHLYVRLLLAKYSAEARIFILVDQFEEVFTLCQDNRERNHFIENLRYAGTVDGGRTVIVITMRADFLSKAAQFTDLAELLSSYPFIVSPMESNDLRRAIEAPALAVGLAFEPELVERILTDMGSEPGALPLMEHALMQVFELRQENRMTLQAYSQSGGVQSALAKKAETIFERFTPEQQSLLRGVMLRLTQPGEGTTDTRRRASQQELWTRADERASVERVIAILTDERLLTTSRAANGEEQVDVAHEALIRGWPRLSQWINEDREGLRLQHRLSEDTKEWHQHQRDDSFLYHGARLAQLLEWQKNNEATLNTLEQEFLEASVNQQKQQEVEKKARQRRELKRTRYFAASLTVAFIVAIVLGLIANSQRQSAEKRQKMAEESFHRSAEIVENFLKLDLSELSKGRIEDLVLRKQFVYAYKLIGSQIQEPMAKDEGYGQEFMTYMNVDALEQTVEGRLKTVQDSKQLHKIEERIKGLHQEGSEEAYYRDGLKLWEELVKQHPNISLYRFAQALSHIVICGILQGDTSRTIEAESNCREGLEIQRQLAEKYDKILLYQLMLPQFYAVVGDHLAEAEHLNDAETNYRKALEIMEKLVAEHPERAISQSALAKLLSSLGELQGQAGRSAEAEANYRQAIAIGEKLVRENPEKTSYQVVLADSLSSLGELQNQVGRPAEAESNYRRAAEFQERLVRDQPEDATYQEKLAVSLLWLGMFHSQTGHPAEAETNYQRALEIWGKLVRQDPKEMTYPKKLAIAHSLLGDLQAEAGRLSEAKASYRKAIETLETLVRNDPKESTYQVALAFTHSSFGKLQAENGHAAEAEASYRRAIALLENLVREHPNEAVYKNALKNSNQKLDNLQSKLDNRIQRKGFPSNSQQGVLAQ